MREHTCKYIYRHKHKCIYTLINKCIYTYINTTHILTHGLAHIHSPTHAYNATKNYIYIQTYSCVQIPINTNIHTVHADEEKKNIS